MALSVAIQMDPISKIDINKDSTFMLALEAQKRGYQLYHYTPTQLSLHHDQLIATAQTLVVRRERGNHTTLGTPQALNLATTDVVLLRQDPPFDMAYITTTHLLEHIHPKTRVVNDPINVRNAPEKLLITHFPSLMPPTLITRTADDVMVFRREYQDIIIKPLFGNGGARVFHVAPQDENLNALLELFTDQWREPFIVQQYRPEIRQGDKRIILVDGTPVGGVLRVPQTGEARANFHAGGDPEPGRLSKRDQAICEAIGPTLKEQGLIFVGIDIIGDYLTEINVTSPTGIQEINRLENIHIEALIWDAIEKRL